VIAFHGDHATKAKYLRRIRNHAKADRLIQGTGWSNGKGCAIGCTLEAYDHTRYPIELGVPMELAKLEDQIFEGLAPSQAMKWPAAFLSAIPVGADLSLAWPRFAVWMLRIELAAYDTAGVCGRVAKLYDRWIAGQKPPMSEWHKARFAATAAAAAAAAVVYAVDAADAAAAATHAADAADIAAVDAADAVDAVANAAAANAPRRGFWRRSSRELLRLLGTSPVVIEKRRHEEDLSQEITCRFLDLLISMPRRRENRNG
jgi:hypothetical protein